MFVWLQFRLNTIQTIYTTKVKQHKTLSVIGIVLLFIFAIQVLSGVMLCFSLNCDPMNIPMSRSEEDIGDLYTDDFFWLHERGVDYIFIFIFVHMFRKFYLSSYTKSQEGAWKTGSLIFLTLHVVTFFGLVLCCTHLSEVTLTIAANMLATASAKYGKIYWWVFPAEELNTDTIIRMMYGHYTTAFIIFTVALLHSLEMHYDWKDTSFSENQKTELSWWDDAIKGEIFSTKKFLLVLFWAAAVYYPELESLSIELFMWGDIGSVSDIRFLGVTPHWYFRAYMSWLVVCPHHYLGLLGLLLFMVSIYFQPNIKATVLHLYFTFKEYSMVKKIHVTTFIAAIMYCASYLPYGKFYNRLGGNIATLCSFMFILYFLLTSLNWYNKLVSDRLNIILS
jgi:quinol-cytochrome oxidoreductase complex cytochrome b subunit